MKNKVINKNNLINNFTTSMSLVKNVNDLEKLRVKYLGKRGYIQLEINQLREMPYEKKKKIGKIINDIKKYIYHEIKIKKTYLENVTVQHQVFSEQLDISLPGRKESIGSIHPITQMIYYIESFFNKLGFNIIHGGLEIENDFHNFEALNIPKFHPARNLQDTFWFDSERLLRTQTSNMQIRIIKEKQLPIQVIVPGKVFRKDCDVTHSPMFHQIEGLVIDKNINFAHLKWIINSFLNDFFNEKMQFRFRSSYFPFTILSAEVDIMQNDCSWLEILGCGMVHPNVLKRFNINNNIYSGLAFGIGIERIIMLYYGIQDLRLFFKNDLKFLKQFKRSRYY
ncbi:phenylalanine--tRNA ligase subunit alpha [Buchnera aphidicola]|uniref:Phenylalanine--tRNA ligase alpha subunit n=1 Tax=Buchnera aphidicola (Stegophylla sp.) TaxID=2315800 RepID=A0A4D6Y9B4_9GAMM|nr:phenylalanine--tRNA ligase subunit alpha [Buchnera aphidicola (Stegophylla sp.)]QCI26277.1 phenylalanine--tRNA ligase subunit alpha [Buchnera aphidicola (Stegophylla sp.)]